MRVTTIRRFDARAQGRGDAWFVDALEGRVLLAASASGGADGAWDLCVTPLPPVAQSAKAGSTKAARGGHQQRPHHRHVAVTKSAMTVAAAVGQRHGVAVGPVVATPTRDTKTLKTTKKVSAAGTASAASTGTLAAGSPLSSVPALHSYAGAKATLFLDFDGAAATSWGTDYNVPTTPAYDIDGDATSFSATELLNIQKIWERVAEKYSPFNVDVTTVDPGTYGDRAAQRIVIGGDGKWFGTAGGVSYVGAFYNSAPNTSWVFPKQLGGGNVVYVAEASAHEAGHAFGLDHQSLYAGTVKQAEYNPGDAATAPIMGNSYSATRGLWWVGPTSASSSIVQNDVSVIAGSSNGFGYRPDDYGGTYATASTTAQVSATTINATGVIENVTDADGFRFTAGAGSVFFTVSRSSSGGMLDATLTLLDANGNVVATGADTGLDEQIARAVPAGQYVIVVGSHGSRGDIGQYTLSGSVQAPPPVPVAPSGVTAASTSTSAVQVSWADNSADEAGFKVERSDDGVTFTQVGTTAANVTTFTDTDLAAGTLYTYRVRATNAAGMDSAASGTASAVTVGGGNGLLGQYFADTSLSNGVMDRTDATVNFDWVRGSPDAAVPVDGFGVRWSGQVQAQTSGDYTFTVNSDDGIRLYVNGELVIDHWGALTPLIGDANLDGRTDGDDISQIAQYAFYNKLIPGRTWAMGDFDGNGLVNGDDISLIAQARTYNTWRKPDTFTATVALQAGAKNDIVLEYMESTGIASAKLQWSAAGVPLQVIPQSQLYS